MADQTLHASGTIATADARRRLADAPAWARATIDQTREKRGLPTLFGRAASPAAPARRRCPLDRVLVGVAAPGVSNPHIIDGDHTGRMLPEIITRSAWDCVAADLLMGKTFDFRMDHEGVPFVRSDDPGVEIEFDPVAGLLFTLSGEAARGFPWPAGGSASICFAARAYEKRMTRRHGWIRAITKMRLDHIALLPPHHDRPAYRHARVVSVPPEQRVKAFVRLRCDARLATKEDLGR